MSLLEKLMKPLLDAQYQKGFEIGYKQGLEMAAAERIEAWKERQRAAGVIFVPDPEDNAQDAEDK